MNRFVSSWLVLGLLASGCVSSSQPQPPTVATTRDITEPPRTRRVNKGFTALMAARDRHGQAIATTNKTVDKHRAVVVVFFASWCGPCRRELRELKRLRTIRPRARIIAVNAHESYNSYSDQRKLNAFLKATHPRLQVVIGTPELLRAFGGIPKVPTVFVFDTKGRLTASIRPPRDAGVDRLVKIIDRIDRP